VLGITAEGRLTLGVPGGGEVRSSGRARKADVQQTRTASSKGASKPSVGKGVANRTVRGSAELADEVPLVVEGGTPPSRSLMIGAGTQDQNAGAAEIDEDIGGWGARKCKSLHSTLNQEINFIIKP